MNGIPQPTAGMLRKVVIASVLGNALEWFDFAVYGLFAGTIAKLFFPASAPSTSLMLALVTFGVGFAFRPLGGVLLGIYGDRVGRKRALSLTILLMAAGTGLIGIVPAYAHIGIAAPVLVVLARMIQGVSAGSEFSSATTLLIEFAPQGRRGLLGSFQMSAQALSFGAGAAVVWLLHGVLTPDDLMAWGWRLPFLFGMLIGPIGWIIRRKVDESPEFMAYANEIARGTARPGGMRFGTLFSQYRREMVASTAACVMGTVSAYVFIIFLPLFAKQMGVPDVDVSRGTFISTAIIFVVCPLSGYLSDRIGRKPLFVTVAVLYGVVAWIVFNQFINAPSAASLMMLQVVAAVFMGFFWGPTPAILAEIFPANSRSTATALTYNLAVLVFGGMAPSINMWLVKLTGSHAAPIYYVELSVVIGVAGGLLLRTVPRKDITMAVPEKFN